MCIRSKWIRVCLHCLFHFNLGACDLWMSKWSWKYLKNDDCCKSKRLAILFKMMMSSIEEKWTWTYETFLTFYPCSNLVNVCQLQLNCDDSLIIFNQISQGVADLGATLFAFSYLAIQTNSKRRPQKRG